MNRKTAINRVGELKTTNDRKRRRINLSVAWIDYKKACGMVPCT